ncbi:6-carboxytetrahydropterin synthase [Candidatus Viridilinea mediisalina]|uniref:6-carboxy-5,6,7,8-tetrahydropterin synthase n=1 Tax=Candidatus Viridilinea mediisalina TaxID=2024553 RepID=A0A2A6RGA0_9CHLR|nr:6-carboxytetrahydropterin synthase [Candidatus Viridilinea mediisalina]PDW01961.1 6-pyruvoyl tetrahydropterin synthase [Candidatus Viridilinea mediisalina]
MLTATRRFEFSAAHRYWRDDWSQAENQRVFGKCISPYGHGHNYTLDVTITGTLDPRTGMVMNMTELKALVNEVLEEFDHKHLNEDTPYFKDQLPTTENLVRVLWQLIAAHLPTVARLAHLRIYEQPDLWADYDGAEETTFARAYSFAAAHRLHAPALSAEENRAVYGKCNNPNGHGHNYTLEVSVTGPHDPATGMVIDLEAMDRSVRAVLDQLDFCHLDHEVAAFADKPSTAENIVVYLWDELAPRFEGRLSHLKLWETRKNVFTYTGPHSV